MHLFTLGTSAKSFDTEKNEDLKSDWENLTPVSRANLTPEFVIRT